MVAKPRDLVTALIKKGGRGRTSRRVAMFIIVKIESEAVKKPLEKPCQAPP